MTHVGNISNHFDAMHHCLSGQAGAPADSPYIGSILAKVRPSQRNVASYVWLIKCVGDPGLLRPEHRHRRPPGRAATARCSSARPTTIRPCPTSRLPTSCCPRSTPERMQDAASLLDGLDPADEPATAVGPRSDWQDLHGRAFELASGPGGRQAFELDREPAAVRDRYGLHPLGQNLLLARRLVEAGVGFVTVNGWTGPSPGQTGGGPPSSSWDMHGGEMGMGNAFGNGSYGMGWCLPRLDEALSALLIDLEERGLLESTLVVVDRRVRPHAAHQPARAPSPAGSTGRRATPRSSPAAAFAAARSTASPTRSAPT